MISRGITSARGTLPSEGVEPSAVALIEKRSSIEIQEIEEDRRNRQRLTRSFHLEPASEPRHRRLEGVRPSIRLQSDDLALENELSRRERPCHLDHLGHGGGDIVERARVHPHILAALVDLNASAIQLPLERCLAQLRQRV